ncbi:MAG: polyprenyl synthetase family protein, partial [Pseudomonadota bacterium]
LGKNTGDDFRERKVTLPVILAYARASSEERAFWQRVIEQGAQEDGDLAIAMESLRRHGALEDTRQKALDMADRARSALDSLPDTEITRLLRDLAGYVVARVV